MGIRARTDCLTVFDDAGARWSDELQCGISTQWPIERSPE